MNPFITFNVNGFNGIGIIGETHRFETPNKGQTETVEFLLEDQDITGIKVLFYSETIIDQELIDSTYQTIELFLATLIGKLDVIIHGFSLEIDQVYNPHLSPMEGSIVVSDMMLLCDKLLSETINYPIGRYEELFLDLPTDDNIRDKTLVFSNIMKIDNIAIRYLMQYEFLMSLVAPHRVQKEVTDFIRDTYNPLFDFNRICFYRTRKPGKTFCEDAITYYRNILAHNDSSAFPDDFENVITNMSKAATKVIFFALEHSS